MRLGIGTQTHVSGVRLVVISQQWPVSYTASYRLGHQNPFDPMETVTDQDNQWYSNSFYVKLLISVTCSQMQKGYFIRRNIILRKVSDKVLRPRMSNDDINFNNTKRFNFDLSPFLHFSMFKK